MVVRIVGAAVASDARVPVTVAAAATGLAIGSFLNVVVYRVPRQLSLVRPGSFCPACGTPIGSWDNVPVVSWLVLRGRCRHCGEPISARYPLVELVTGVLFAAVAWALGAHWAVPGMCILGATSLTLAAIEIDGIAPPASASLVGSALGAVLLSAAAVVDRRWWHLGGMWIGIAIAGCVVAGGTAIGSRRGARFSGLWAGRWAVIPAGAVLGWVGALGAGVGVSTSALCLVGLSALLRARPQLGDSRRFGGVALAVAVGSAAAVIGAFVAGSPIGR